MSDTAGLPSDAILSFSFVFRRAEGPFPAFLALVPRPFLSDFNVLAHTILTRNDLQSYERIRVDKRRFTFLAGRLAAKCAANAYLGGSSEDVQSIRVGAGVFGQPLIIKPGEPPPLVSITHTDEQALAVCCHPGHPVGIDLEAFHPDSVPAFLREMTDQETAAASTIADLPEWQRFNALWSMKEALSKVLRCGLTTPFRTLETTAVRLRAPLCLEAEFSHFSQYRAVAHIGKKNILAMVCPKRSAGDLPTELIAYL